MSPDADLWAFVDLDVEPVPIAAQPRPPGQLAPLAFGSGYLSVRDIAARWSCSRAFVYRAIGEMERAGYVRRVFLGKSDQRVALDAIETWERLHSAPIGAPGRRAEVATLRRPRAHARSRAASAGPSIVETWKRMKASRASG